jgi:uncharacterized RDD family membrane protein YckC
VTQHGYPYQQPGPGQPYGGQPAGAPQPGYGAPPGYGVPQQPGYGAPQRPAYGAPPQAGYGVPPQAAYGQVGPGQPGYPAQQGWAPPAVAPSGEPLAEQVTRLLARLIDGLIIGGVVAVIWVPVLIFAIVASSNELEVADDGTVTGGGSSIALILLAELGLFVFILAAQYLYEVEYAKRTGQTIGKRALKIRVIALAPQQPLNRGIMTKRWLVTGPGGLVPGLTVINAIWCLWDKPYRQCLHDKFADTVVVKVPG